MALTRITKGVIKPNENYDTHNINSTGIITATKFVGPVTGAITGTADLASGLTGTPSITVQDVVAVGATFTGNVSIGGTLTYEDVTNIDSVGLITARDGIEVTGGTLKLPAVLQTNTAANLRVLYQHNDNVIHGGSGLLYNPAEDTLKVNGNLLSATSLYGAGGTLKLAASNHSSTNYVLIKNKIEMGGDVGINTTTPQAMLDVRGNTVIGIDQVSGNPGNTTGITTIRGHFVNAEGDFARLYFSNSLSASGAATRSSASIRGIRLGDNLGTGLGFWTNPTTGANPGVERLRITQNGQTLINQTSALDSAVMLGVKNPTSNDTVVDVVCGNTTAGSHIAFSDTAYARGIISYNHANDFLAFRTNGVTTDRLHITSAGHVIIGGTSWGAAGSMSIASYGGFRSILASGQSQDTMLGAISGVSNGFQINTDGSNNQTYTFHNGSGVSLRIASNGKVGIGITNPAEKFQVNGGNIAITGGSSYKIDTHPLVSYAGFTDISGGSYAARLGSTGSSTIRSTQIYGGGSHIATFDGVNYRLGIKETTPEASLHITGGLPHIRLENSGTSASAGDILGQIDFKHNDSDDAGVTAAIKCIAEDNAGNSYLTFNNGDGGNPDERLRISSDGQLTHTTNKASGYIATFNQAHASNTGSIQINSPTDTNIRPTAIDLAQAGTVKWSIGQVYASTSDRAFHICSGSNSESNSKVTIDTAGRVFIGRVAQYASSSEKLSVNGMTSIQYASASSAGLYIFNTESTSDGTVQPYLFLHDGSGIRSGLGVQRNTGKTILNGQFGLSLRTGASGVGGSEKLSIATSGLHTINCDSYSALDIKSNNNDNNGPEVQLIHNSASPAAGDCVGQIRFKGNDSAGNSDLMSRIETIIGSPTSGAESAHINFATRGLGAFNTILRLNARSSASAPSYTTDDMNGIILDTYNTGNPYPRYFNFIAKSAGNTASNIGFWTESVGGSPTEKLRITSTGKVGINYDVASSDPQYGQLELIKSGVSNADPDWSYLSFHRVGQIAWQQGIDSNDFVIATTGGSAKDTLDAEKLRITSSGKLLLGDTNTAWNANSDSYKMTIKESSAENACIMFMDTDSMKGGLCGISKGNNDLISGTTNVDFVVGSMYAETHIIASPANVSNTVIAMTVAHDRIKLWENVLISNNVVHTGNTNSNIISERVQILPSENDGYDDSHILSAVQTAGNWEQGAGASNYDSSWGWIWQYSGSATSTKQVRAGICYDHKGSEEFKYWSSYGAHAFYVDTGKSGDETAETCGLKAFQIRHDGEIIGNGGANGKVRHNSCQRWQWGGSASCNSTWSVSIPPLTGGGGGNIYHIKAYFSHHSLGYGAYLDGVYCAYAGHAGMQQTTAHHSHTSPNGGSWGVTRGAIGDPVVVTHTAGSYNGSGHWFVWVLAGHQ